MFRNIFVVCLLLLLILTSCSSDNQYTLEMRKEGHGIIKPEVGEHVYQAGEKVTLEAIAGEDWEFSIWRGSIKSDRTSLEIVMDDDLSIEAVFVDKSSEPPSWQKTPSVQLDKEQGIVKLRAELDKEGRLYYQLLDYGVEAPSPEQLRKEGEQVLSSDGQQIEKNIKDLLTNKDYYLFIVAESKNGILQEQVIKREILFGEDKRDFESEIKRYNFDFYDDRKVELGRVDAEQEVIIAITTLYFEPEETPAIYDLEIDIEYDSLQKQSLNLLSQGLTTSSIRADEQSKLDWNMRKREQQLLRKGVEKAEPSYSALDTFHLGEQRSFYISRDGTQIEAKLKRISEEALIYLEKDYKLAEEILDKLAREFDNNIYPEVMKYFGGTDTSVYDWDNNGKKIILIKDMSQRGEVRGYFRPDDFYQLDYSNQADMIYLNYQTLFELEEGSSMDDILATMAHELQHLIFQVEKYISGREGSDIWINEAFSGLAEYLTGYNDFNEDRWINEVYFAEPYNESLLQWSSRSPSYGSTRLFALYLFNRLGEGVIREIISSPEDALTVISEQFSEGDFTDFYLDWLLSNYVSSIEGDGDYSYPINLHSRPQIKVIENSISLELQLYSTAVKYFLIKGQDKNVKLDINLSLAERIGVITYLRR